MVSKSEAAQSAAGFATGAGISVGATHVIAKGAAALVRAAPAVARVAPALGPLGWGVMAATTLGGGAYRGWQSYARGDEMGDVVKSSMWGLVGIDRAEAQQAKNVKKSQKVEAPPAPEPEQAAQIQSGAPKSRFDQTREALDREQKQLEKALETEMNRPNAKGYGKQSEAISKRLREIAAERGVNDDRESRFIREQREFEAKQPNAFMTALNIGMAAGSLLGGSYLGGKLAKSMAQSSTDAAKATVAGINKAGTEAARLLKSKGILAGTPAGDKAAAIVARMPSKAELASLGKPSMLTYGIPAFNVAHGAGMVVASTYVEDKTMATTMRLEGLGAIGMGVWGGKTLMAASALRAQPSRQAINAIEGVNKRLVRETEAGALKASEHKVAQAIAGSKQQLDKARVRGKIADVRGSQDVKIASAKGNKAVKKAAAVQPPKAAEPAALKPTAAQRREAAMRSEAARKAAITRVQNAERHRRSEAARVGHKIRAIRQQAVKPAVDKWGGIRANGRGFANPKVQAAAQKARGAVYKGPSG